MPRNKSLKKRGSALPIAAPKSTDEWQEVQDLEGEPEVIDDNLDAMVADEPPRLVSDRLVRDEKAAHESE
jgi:hypothetical protein